MSINSIKDQRERLNKIIKRVEIEYPDSKRAVKLAKAALKKVSD